MYLVHKNEAYECDVAIKCENDGYIRLYDTNGIETNSFYGISDFSEYKITGGSFTTPDACKMPIPVSSYMVGGVTITPDDWISQSGSKYSYEIECPLMSDNATTCNVFISFKPGTPYFKYDAAQETGKIVLLVETVPTNDIIINSIQFTRA